MKIVASSPKDNISEKKSIVPEDALTILMEKKNSIMKPYIMSTDQIIDYRADLKALKGIKTEIKDIASKVALSSTLKSLSGSASK